MVCFRHTVSLQIFKGCFPQILHGLFLNTLCHIFAGGTDFHQCDYDLWIPKVNESRYKQCGVTPHFSTGQNLLDRYADHK